MTAHREPLGIPESEDETEAVEQVVEDVRDEIRHGHVEDDVTHVLEVRLHEAGVDLRPETIDDLAEEIENDVSMRRPRRASWRHRCEPAKPVPHWLPGRREGS